MKTPPVLLILFRRPEETKRVFAAIRSARPEKLFLAADGPRLHKDGEAELCRLTRETVAGVDWPCDVQTKFRENNVGIRKNISEAISWFLKEAGEGVILEDDCLPSPDFFRFAAENLEKFRSDTRIMQICGSRFVGNPNTSRDSYFFSRYGHGWGWATWHRAWARLDLELVRLESFLEEARRSGFWDSWKEEIYWTKTFRRTRDLPIDTWDYQWKFSIWKEGGLSIYPRHNLVSNLGFGAQATNTTETATSKGDRPHEPLGEIVHPEFVLRDRRSDAENFRRMYWGTPVERWSGRVKKLVSLLGKRR